jgi:hypothetical protein
MTLTWWGVAGAMILCWQGIRAWQRSRAKVDALIDEARNA